MELLTKDKAKNEGIKEAKLGSQVTKTGWIVYLGVTENNSGKANQQMRAVQGQPHHLDV